ncbi:MAG TPA: FkbM family methyltransferase [Longimicrobium sp.]|nr:FkbM family methyltransferase [Longimicrobium sp.]
MRRLPKAIRSTLSVPLERIPVRIRAGINAGLKWSLATAGRGYVRGTFEHRRVSTFAALLRAGDVVWDVGAHKGYMTLAAARTVTPEGHVVAIEPASDNRNLLKRHVRWNRLSNVRVLGVALADYDGTARFGGSGSSVTYRIGRGDEVVTVRTVSTLIENENVPRPSILKIDAEGAEGAILRGACSNLPADLVVFISIHDFQAYHDCKRVLDEHGFRTFASTELRRTLRDRGGRWGGDKELLAVGPKRSLPDEMINALPLFRDGSGD